ncbi:hypothetical protein [Pseudomonas huanghezhanensis]|uniref:hypothetical protein n=1 Tax=Pseudomonas huanghezhanensis TaxID=3002903 RepID=UPI002285D2C8|nr:hypothetical protein [Pseudomonas sp. BSw22131]
MTAKTVSEDDQLNTPENDDEPSDIDPGNEDPGSQLGRDATVPLIDPDHPAKH